MYIIKIIDETKKDKCYVGHSNASGAPGFYLTLEHTAKLFVKDIAEMPKLKDWLETKNYSYEIVEVSDKKHRRIY